MNDSKHPPPDPILNFAALVVGLASMLFVWVMAWPWWAWLIAAVIAAVVITGHMLMWRIRRQMRRQELAFEAKRRRLIEAQYDDMMAGRRSSVE